MSPPTELLVSRYRSFAGDERLPLRPLTLLYGRNNAGKSALARALGVLGASVAEKAYGAFCLPPGMRAEVELEDVAWKGEAGNYSFTLGLSWGEGEVREARFTIDLDGSQKIRAAVVTGLEILGEGGAVLWVGVRHPDGRMLPEPGYTGSPLVLVGLVPGEHELSAICTLGERMRALRDRVRWLDGVRARPPSEYVQPRATVEHAGNGADAYDRLAGRPELIEDVQRFYAALDQPRELEVKAELSNGYRFRLTPASTPGFRIDLSNTGEGMVQVLPVLVAAAVAAQEGAGTILAVEEPESHLHPDAQATLARYLCALAAQPNPPCLVLETHSRVFLLAVQLAVAKGDLTPDRVSLVWVDQDAKGQSHVTPVELTATGHPGAGWPPIALIDDLRLAAELSRVNLTRKE